MEQDYQHPPDLTAATPRTPHDNYSFGFRTPEPKSKQQQQQQQCLVSPGQTKKSRSSSSECYNDGDDDDALLPSFYKDKNHNNRTPAEKVSYSMRRLRKKLSTSIPEPMSLESRYNSSIGSIKKNSRNNNRTRRVGAVLTFILLLLGGVALYQRENLASSSSNNSYFQFRPTPVANSPSDIAVKLYRDAFENDTNQIGSIGLDDPLNPGSILILLTMSTKERPNKDSNLVTEDTETFKEMKDFVNGYEHYLLEHMSNLLAIQIPKGDEDDNGSQDLIRVTSFYGLESVGLSHAAEAHYATSDGRSLLVDIRFAIPQDIALGRQQQQDMNDYQASLINAIQNYEKAHLPDYVEARYTGLPLIQADLLRSNSKQSKKQNSSHDMDNDIGLEGLLPESAPSLETYKLVSERFGWGSLSSYRIIFDGHESGTRVDTNEGFHIMHEILVELMKVDDAVESIEDRTEEEIEMLMGIAVVNLDSIPQRIEDGRFKEHLDEVMDELFGFHGFPFQGDNEVLPVGGIRGQKIVPHMRTVYDGIAFIRNNPVPYPLYYGSKRCAEMNKPHCPVEMLHHFVHINKEVTSTDQMSTYVTATLGVDPFSQRGLAWLKTAREKIQQLNDEYHFQGIKVAIEGGASLEYDRLLAGGSVGLMTTNNQSYSLVAWGLVLSLFALFVHLVKSPPLWLLSGRKKSDSYDYKDV